MGKPLYQVIVFYPSPDYNAFPVYLLPEVLLLRGKHLQEFLPCEDVAVNAQDRPPLDSLQIRRYLLPHPLIFHYHGHVQVRPGGGLPRGIAPEYQQDEELGPHGYPVSNLPQHIRYSLGQLPPLELDLPNQIKVRMRKPAVHIQEVFPDIASPLHLDNPFFLAALQRNLRDIVGLLPAKGFDLLECQSFERLPGKYR